MCYSAYNHVVTEAADADGTGRTVEDFGKAFFTLAHFFIREFVFGNITRAPKQMRAFFI